VEPEAAYRIRPQKIKEETTTTIAIRIQEAIAINVKE